MLATNSDKKACADAHAFLNDELRIMNDEFKIGPLSEGAGFCEAKDWGSVLH
jgi:hypothetical protein